MVNYVENTDVHGAGNGAMPAAHAEIHSEAFLIKHELVHGPLPPASVFCRAWIMAPCFKCKVNIVAGIVALVTNTCIPVSYTHLTLPTNREV